MCCWKIQPKADNNIVFPQTKAKAPLVCVSKMHLTTLPYRLQLVVPVKTSDCILVRAVGVMVS